ncbi:MAG: ATPase, partial [Gammaproteobacteria bacterium]|nr:ATPase [Gammaproteobacteria bacterium]
VGGSLCELDEHGVIDILVDNTLILYIQVTNDAQEKVLIERAVSDPKPLYYRPEFLQEHLQLYFQETGLEYAAQIDPDEFARWVFPRLFRSRLPRYDAIAKLGYTVTSEEVDRVQNDVDFVNMLEMAIERQPEGDA